MNATEPQPCPPLSILRVRGRDATAVLNNLTTNALASMAAGGESAIACETFVTDIRGRCLGHVMAVWTGYHWWLVGAAGQSRAIADHVDRYTIREDVDVEVLDDQRFGSIRWSEGGVLKPSDVAQPRTYRTLWDRVSDAGELDVPWWGAGGGRIATLAIDSNVPMTGAASFHRARVEAGFPWYDVDLNEKNLPQEAGRDVEAINFHKGCYLGQETIARLDALGQVQKQLRRIRLTAGPRAGQAPAPGDVAFAEAATTSDVASANRKPVMRITSTAGVADVVDDGPTTLSALAMTRRSHFDVAAVALTECGWVATVVGVPEVPPSPRSSLSPAATENH